MNSGLCRWATGMAISASCVVTLGCSCGETVLGTPRAHDDAGSTTRKLDSGSDGTASDGTVIDAALDAYTPGTGVRPRSGSQITVVGLRSEDAETGATDPRFQNVTDPELRDRKHGVTCAVRLATDGKARCLPTQGSVFFTDANCTQPIAAEYNDDCDPDAPGPAYVTEYWGGGTACNRARLSAYKVGAIVPNPSAVYKQTVFGCAPEEVPFTGTYREATPVPLTEWVKYERRTVKVTDRLGVSTLSGSDGSLLIEGLTVLPEDVLCGAAIQGGPTARCIPSNRLGRPNSGGTHFADADCRDALAAQCELNPALMEGFDTPTSSPNPGPCPPRTFPKVGSLFKVGKLVDHSEIHMLQNDVCVIAPPEKVLGAFYYYSTGAPVPFDDYPIVGEVLSGNGRLQQVGYVSENGTKLYTEPGIFFDTVAKTYCSPSDPLFDGRTVCVPPNALTPVSGSLFGDAQCTQPVSGGLGCGGPLGISSESRVTPSGETYACSYQLNRLTPHVGPVFTTEAGMNCQPFVPDLALPLQTYDVGEPVELEAAFPPLESFDF